ncbi:MAG: C-terminal binding protein [Armatimonadetes bacterium]|nr:C-terminal binding protein [Armatimonadota bacterium]
MGNVVVTDYNLPSVDKERKILKDAGFELREAKPDCKTEDDVIRNCGDADVLLVQWAPITRRVLDALPRVKCLVRYGIGVNNLDLEACKELGVTACNVPDFCIEEVSNHALAMILSLARRIPHDHNSILRGGWDINQFRPIPALSDMTLGLVGLGNIARLLARKAQALLFKVIAYDPLVPASVFTELGVEQVGLEELLSSSDVVSLHCPLLPETNHLINRETIGKMKPGALVVNTSRGPIINEADLFNALESGKLAGAGLDVFKVEPLPMDSPLRRLSNIILTSHCAAVSEKAVETLQIKVAEAARDFLQGKRPRSALT